MKSNFHFRTLLIALLVVLPSTTFAFFKADTAGFDHMFSDVVGKDVSYMHRDFKFKKGEIKKAVYIVPDGTVEFTRNKDKVSATDCPFVYTRKYNGNKNFTESGDFNSMLSLASRSYSYKGKPALCADGYSSMRSIYAPSGVTNTYYGVDGKPVNNASGYASRAFTTEIRRLTVRGDRALIMTVRYYDADGNPVTCSEGYHAKTVIADGSQIRVGYRDCDFKRVSYNGYSDIVYKPLRADQADDSKGLNPMHFALCYFILLGPCEIDRLAPDGGDECCLLNSCVDVMSLMSGYVKDSPTYFLDLSALMQLHANGKTVNFHAGNYFTSPTGVTNYNLINLMGEFNALSKNGGTGAIITDWEVTCYSPSRDSVESDGCHTRFYRYRPENGSFARS